MTMANRSDRKPNILIFGVDSLRATNLELLRLSAVDLATYRSSGIARNAV